MLFKAISAGKLYFSREFDCLVAPLRNDFDYKQCVTIHSLTTGIWLKLILRSFLFDLAIQQVYIYIYIYIQLYSYLECPVNGVRNIKLNILKTKLFIKLLKILHLSNITTWLWPVNRLEQGWAGQHEQPLLPVKSSRLLPVKSRVMIGCWRGEIST